MKSSIDSTGLDSAISCITSLLGITDISTFMKVQNLACKASPATYTELVGLEPPILPPRELTYPTLGKRKSSSKVPGRGYASFEEGNSSSKTTTSYQEIGHFTVAKRVYIVASYEHPQLPVFHVFHRGLSYCWRLGFNDYLPMYINIGLYYYIAYPIKFLTSSYIHTYIVHIRSSM